MKEALYYRAEGNSLKCELCPKECTINEGKTGFCLGRRNINAKLVAENYGRCTSVAVDPIEKKPLYHFYPGSQVLSIGTFGCNFSCKFCQNWGISQQVVAADDIGPEKIAELADKYAQKSNNFLGVAFTYSEPSVWYEFVFDASTKVRKKGLKNILVTNGYMQEKPLLNLLPNIDAMNIDLKAFTNEFYRSFCAGNIEPVKRTVELANQACHIELTVLLITGCNDSEEEITQLCDWVASVNKEIPLHFSRYFPNYRLNLPPTPFESLERAKKIAEQRLDYVYIGNAPELNSNNTICPSCKKVVIRRGGFGVMENNIIGEKCQYCGARIAIEQDDLNVSL